MTMPSPNRVHHVPNGGVSWCGIQGPWQEERRPLEQVRGTRTEYQWVWDPQARRDRNGRWEGEWIQKPTYVEGLVEQRISWYANSGDQIATSYLPYVTCPRCLDERQRVLRIERERQEKLRQKRRQWRMLIVLGGIVLFFLLAGFSQSCG